jgi:hypothetical protein
MNEDEIKTGTARWYSPNTNKKGTSIPGKFSLKQNISSYVPFENGEELIVEVDEKKGTVCIRKLRS